MLFYAYGLFYIYWYIDIVLCIITWQNIPRKQIQWSWNCFLSKWVHRNISYTNCRNGAIIYFLNQHGLSNLTTYNITYLSRKELNSCWNLLVKFFEGKSLECNSFVILKPSSMNFPNRISCWSTADWTDNWWWRVSIILLLMLISCRIFDVSILKFGASTEMRFHKYIDGCRVIHI